MRKVLAWLLTLAALLTSLAALAEDNATIVRISDISVSYVGATGARSVRFEDAGLTLALGSIGGATTLQVMFDNGEGQAVDAVFQLVGREILFSMGGLSANYTIDLESFATPGTSGDAIAKGLSNSLAMAGSHLDVLLYAITRAGADGMRSLEAPLPMPQLIAAAEALLSAADGTQAADEAGLSDLVVSVNDQDEARMGFRYNPKTGAFDLAAIQDGTGMRLSGTLEIRFEPMDFIDISADATTERFDLMSLTPEAQAQLREELGFILSKFVNYADGTGLGGILPEY